MTKMHGLTSHSRSTTQIEMKLRKITLARRMDWRKRGQERMDEGENGWKVFGKTWKDGCELFPAPFGIREIKGRMDVIRMIFSLNCPLIKL